MPKKYGKAYYKNGVYSYRMPPKTINYIQQQIRDRKKPGVKPSEEVQT